MVTQVKSTEEDSWGRGGGAIGGGRGAGEGIAQG